MVILINRFTVRDGVTAEEFERVWKQSAGLMQRQPGFIHFRFVRSLFTPNSYTNIAAWTDRESHDRVIRSPEFAEHIKALGAVATPAPELHEVVYEGVPIGVAA